MAAPSDSERLNQIMKIDTNALLDTLKDIETKLSSYHRADEIPAWASSLIPRLEIIEMKTAKMEKKVMHPTAGLTGGGAPGSSGVSTNTIQEMQLEGRILDRIKSELDAQVGTTRLTLEGKVSSITLELDRLHKLLQIRPTTSELQKVVLSIQDIKKTVAGNMAELSNTVEMIVKEKVVQEMSAILDRLKATENHTTSNMKMILDKMELMTGDMSTMRTSVQNGLDMVKYELTEAKATIDESKTRLDELQRSTDQSIEDINSTFLDLQAAQKESNDTVAELGAQLAESTKALQSGMDGHEEMIQAITVYNTEANNRNAREFAQLTDLIGEVRNNYVLDSEQQKAHMNEMKEQITSMQERLEEQTRNLEVLVKADVLTSIANMEQRLNEDKKHLLELEERISGVNSRLGKMNKAVTTLQESHEALATQVTTNEEKMIAMDSEIRGSIDNINKDMQKQMSDLVVVRDEAAVVKTLGHAADQRVKVIQQTMSDLLVTTEAFANKFTDLSMRIEKEKIDTLRQVQEAEDALKIAMCEKHAEIEGAVQNIKENLDLMAQAGEMEKHGPGGGGAKGGIGAKHGHGPPGVRGKIGSRMGPGGPGANRHTDNNSVGSHRDAASTLASLGLLSGNASEGGVVPAITAEEQLAVAQSHAQFIADLCINFEEVSIRRADVPEIPGVIIENVIATIQVLTAFIANCADAEAVGQVLRASPDELSYEDLVSEKRHLKLEQFLSEMYKLLMENNKQPGAVRLEAREKFVNMLRMALDLCISKHEQVVVTGNTRVGRVKIPTCIACDRPLLEKVRQDKVKDPALMAAYESLNRSATAIAAADHKAQLLPIQPGNTTTAVLNQRKAMAKNSVASALGMPTTATLGEDSLSQAAAGGGGGNAAADSKLKMTKDGRPKLLESVRLPVPQREAGALSPPPATSGGGHSLLMSASQDSLFSNSAILQQQGSRNSNMLARNSSTASMTDSLGGMPGGAQTGGGASQSAYVLRGGFKMPRPSTSAAHPTGMVVNHPGSALMHPGQPVQYASFSEATGNAW